MILSLPLSDSGNTNRKSYRSYRKTKWPNSKTEKKKKIAWGLYSAVRACSLIDSRSNIVSTIILAIQYLDMLKHTKHKQSLSSQRVWLYPHKQFEHTIWFHRRINRHAHRASIPINFTLQYNTPSLWTCSLKLTH